MKDSMKIEFESKSSNEAFARVAVTAFIAKLDPSISEVSEIKTAVSEAVTNSIIHGYRSKPGKIYISCGIDNNQIEITVTDKGQGIDNIDRAREPLFTTNTDGQRSGMGFTVMETFMDDIAIKSLPGIGTKIVMRKILGEGVDFE